jgi:hypothetical protein
VCPLAWDFASSAGTLWLPSLTIVICCTNFLAICAVLSCRFLAPESGRLIYIIINPSKHICGQTTRV